MYTKKACTRKKMCAFDNIYNIYIWQYILQSCPINNKYSIFVHDSKHSIQKPYSTENQKQKEDEKSLYFYGIVEHDPALLLANTAGMATSLSSLFGRERLYLFRNS